VARRLAPAQPLDGPGWLFEPKYDGSVASSTRADAQLINVPTGEIVLDDSTELKGDPEPMVRAGVRIFAERVERTIRERATGQRAERP
jgi:hypothetical protein